MLLFVTKYGDLYPRSNCIPSTTSSVVSPDLDSSIVTIPSRPTFSTAVEIKDQYGNLLSSWGVYEKTITLENIGEKPIMSVKILKQFESVKEAQKYLDKLLGNE